MAVEIVSAEARLKELTGDWEQLVESQKDALPFQLPTWQLTWWQHFGSGALQFIACWEEGRLAAAVPLFCHSWNGRNQLTLIGTGLSDWTDPVMQAAHLETIEHYLASNADWDVLDWQDLSANHPLRSLKDVSIEDDVPCSEVPLNGTFEEFWAARSKELRRNVRRYSLKALEAGPMSFEVTAEADPILIDELIRLHGLRWQKQGQAGMVVSNHSDQFLRDVAKGFAARDMLRIFSVRWCEKIVAIVLALPYRSKVYSYLSAFDPEHESLGFGRILLFESFRYCYSKGYIAWNFLRGTEPYKTSWGAVSIPKIRLYKAR